MIFKKPKNVYNFNGEDKEPIVNKEFTIYILHFCQKICIMLAIVIVLLFVYEYHNTFSAQGLKNLTLSIMSAHDGGEDVTSRLKILSNSKVILPYQNYIAMANESSLSITMPSGITTFGIPVHVSNLDLDVSENAILGYDRGGTSLFIADGYSIKSQFNFPSNIINANINKDEYIAVVAEETGYKSAVSILDDNLNTVYKWYTSEYYLISADISDNSNYIGVSGFYYDNGKISSKIIIFDINKDMPIASVELGDCIAVDIRFISSNNIAVLTDIGAYIINTKGDILSKHEFYAGDLLAYSVGDYGIALALSSKKVGYRSEIVVVSKNKEVLSSFLEEDVRDLSMSDKYIGVLATEAGYILDDNLNIVYTEQNSSDVREIIMQNNGSAYLIYSDSARVISIFSQ